MKSIRLTRMNFLIFQVKWFIEQMNFVGRYDIETTQYEAEWVWFRSWIDVVLVSNVYFVHFDGDELHEQSKYGFDGGWVFILWHLFIIIILDLFWLILILLQSLHSSSHHILEGIIIQNIIQFSFSSLISSGLMIIQVILRWSQYDEQLTHFDDDWCIATRGSTSE